jgi:PAS domain S-box-containing protein
MDPNSLPADSDFAEGLFASIELSPIATVITDPRLPDNPLVAVNDAFVRLTGYSKMEIIGRNCRFLAGPKTDPGGSDVLRQAVARSAPGATELLNYRKDGSSFWNAVIVAPIFDAEGEPAFFLGSQVDVGEVPAHPAVARLVTARKRLDRLTPRQLQVLKDMSLGFRNKQIAWRLGIDEKTVKMHRAALLKRLDVPTSADSIRIAVEAGI